MKKERNNWLFILILIVSILSFSCGCYAGQTVVPISNEYINEETINSDLNNIEETNITKEEKEEILYTTTDVNIRREPSENSEIIMVAIVNTEVKRVDIIDNWSKIKWEDNNYYYIYNDYLSIELTEIKETPISRANIERATSGTKAELQNYAYSLFSQYNWDENDFECLINLWTRESNWNPDSHNEDSGAHGIPQALPASKMASAGDDYYTNGETQIRWGLDYIANRYESPSIAWDHFLTNNWY